MMTVRRCLPEALDVKKEHKDPPKKNSRERLAVQAGDPSWTRVLVGAGCRSSLITKMTSMWRGEAREAWLILEHIGVVKNSDF